MKQKRVVPSDARFVTIQVQGTKHHYFHSQALGKCRAIIIAEEENLASAPGQALKDLERQQPELFAPAPPEKPAYKPAPTKCWMCGCRKIAIMTVGKHPPAYICRLCDGWLGDV